MPLLHLLASVAFGGSLAVGLHPNTPADRFTVRVAAAGEPLTDVQARPDEVTAIPGPRDDAWLWIELETPTARTARLMPPGKLELRSMTAYPVQSDSHRPPLRYVDLDGQPIPGLLTSHLAGEISSRDGWLGHRTPTTMLGLPGGWRIEVDPEVPPADVSEVVLPVRRVPVPLVGALYAEHGLEELWEPWPAGLATRDFVDGWLPVGTFQEEWLDGEVPRRRRIAVPERGPVVVTDLVPEAVTVRVEPADDGNGRLAATGLFRQTGPSELVLWPRRRPLPVLVWQYRGTGDRAIPVHTREVLLEPGEAEMDVPLALPRPCHPWRLRSVPEGLFVQRSPGPPRSARDPGPSALEALTWGMIVTSVNGASVAGWTDRWLSAKRAEIVGPLELEVQLDGRSRTIVVPAAEVCTPR